MDYYDSFRDHQRPYGRQDDYVPHDIDGPPPPGFNPGTAGPPQPSFSPWAPPSYGSGREYHTSPPRRYPTSPDRRHSSLEDFIPAVFPRMDPPTGYSDYGPDHERFRPPYHPEYGHQDYDRRPGPGYGAPDHERRPPPPDYGPPDFDRRPPPPDYGPPDFDRRPPPPDYGPPDFDRRPPPPDYGHPAFGHPDYDRRGGPPPPGFEFDGRGPHPDYDRRGPPPDFGHPDYDRRGPPPRPPPEGYPPNIYPPPPHGPMFDEPRFDAAAGRPPPPYEPEPHAHHHEPHAHHAEPAPPPPPQRQPSPPHPPPDEGVFPPMPYEPDVAGENRGVAPPPPVSVTVHVEEPALHFPPLPYEPEGGSPAHHHGDAGVGARGLGDYPPEPPPRMEVRGDEGAVPYMPEMGIPPPFPDAHYGQATEHGHVKRKHFEGCKDYWAGFLFLLHFLGVVGVCIYLGVRGIIKTNENEELARQAAFRASLAPSQPVPKHLYSIEHWAPQLATAAAAGWVFAFLWQWLVRTKTTIKVCLSLGAVSTGLLGIILVSTGTAKGLVGLIFVVAALFQGLYVHLVKSRIPFAATMLKRTREVVKRHKSLHLVSMWTVFLAMFWLAIWIFGVSGAVSLPHGGWYAALLVISLAWSMEVLRNIVYITVSSVVGEHYYEGRRMHHFPVVRAYRRAWTISFGSVCLGSMFVGPVQALHSMAKRLANEQGANEFLFSCVNCFLGVMEFFNRHFNKWAFVEVGLHGKSFVKSAKQTWQMLKDQDAMLLINDDLTGAILLSSCIIGGVLTALVGGCWTFATHRYLTVGVSILSFIIGFFVTYLTLVVPESAVATYFVCFAEDPATLKKQNEPMYQYMSQRKADLDQEIQ